jgi:hypothetical protein
MIMLLLSFYCTTHPPTFADSSWAGFSALSLSLILLQLSNVGTALAVRRGVLGSSWAPWDESWQRFRT